MMDGITEFGTLCDLGHSVTLVIIYSDIVIYLYSGKGCDILESVPSIGSC